MSNEEDTEQWLRNELAAVTAKIQEVKTAKAAYLVSYQLAIDRLEKGKAQLEKLLQPFD